MAAASATSVERRGSRLVLFCAQGDDSREILSAALAVFAPVRVDAARLKSARFADAAFLAFEGAKVAVVSMDGVHADEGFDVLSELRAAEFGVIACASGADHWPIALRARVLLAGAEAIVDSGDPNTATLVRDQVVLRLDAQATRNGEQNALVARMRDMNIGGRSPKMLSLYGDLSRLSRLSDVPVLIQGETGTGKELFARALHALDAKRCTGPFRALNCAALHGGTAESELFGHRRGAFTGADRDRPGLFRAASGGVLFLDEVGELDLALQAKLLRVLQERHVLAVGDDRETPFDTRVVAATNRSLADMVTANAFRADLYHRLSVAELRLPPLRERRDDLATLVAHFVDKHTALAVQPVTGTSKEFIQALSCLTLPGNARELENLVRRILLAKFGGGAIDLADLPHDALVEIAGRAQNRPHEAQSAWMPPPATLPAQLIDLCASRDWKLADLLAEVERIVLAGALEKSNGDIAKVADSLGLKPRTLFNKRRKYRLDS